MTSKTFSDNVMSANFDVIAIFLIYGLFGAIQKPESGCMVFGYYFSILNLTFCIAKTKKTLKDLEDISHIITLKKGAIFT